MIVPLALGQSAVQSGDWGGTQAVHPIAALTLAIVLIGAIRSGRGGSLAWVGALFVFVPMSQRIVVLGVDLPPYRLAILAVLLREAVRSGSQLGSLRFVDLMVLLFCSSYVVAGILRNEGDLAGRFGVSLDYAGPFLIARASFGTFKAWQAFVRGLALIAILAAPLYIYERLAGQNLFAVMGGVPLTPMMRNGVPRCQGAFSHAILSGLYFAVASPLLASMFVWRWSLARDRMCALGLLASLFIVFSSTSSTPLSALLVACLFGLVFPWRWLLPAAAWSLPVVLVAAHFSLSRGLPSLLAKIDLVGGSTGWHRYHLLDMGIAHIGEWIAVGVASTAHWGVGLGDVTNEVMFHGVRAGFVAAFSYAAILVVSVRQLFLGSLVRSAEGQFVVGRQRWQYLHYGGMCGLLGAVAATSSVAFSAPVNFLVFALAGAGVAASSVSPSRYC